MMTDYCIVVITGIVTEMHSNIICLVVVGCVFKVNETHFLCQKQQQTLLKPDIITTHESTDMMMQLKDLVWHNELDS